MTPHIQAPEGAFGSLCLLPGDPKRAQFIAQHFLTDVQEVNAVRNMLGYTGFYKNCRLSVMGTGMGIPSSSIYATELIKHYGVTHLLRVGSCGAVMDDIHVNDVIIATGASTDSGVNRQRFGGFDYAACADYCFLKALNDAARQLGIPVKNGGLFSADLFYGPDPDFIKNLVKMRILGVEMESAGLFGLAAEYGVHAGSICTVSDHIIQGESMPSQQREQGFIAMMHIALEASYHLIEGQS